jgi:mannosyl-oligosaccharide alpha-1,2-mannosidase
MITLGALGDSFYEYLLKVWIFSGQKNPDDAYLRRLYDEAIEGVEKYLVYDSIGDEMTFLQELRVPSLAEVHRMDHLLCFVPGLIALGTLYEPKDSIKNIKHLRLAKKLMHTCYQLYHLQPTGLSPDIVTFPGLKVSDPKYRLRPETIESLFYLWRVTKDPIYRDMGYEIFQNIEKHCRTEHGYAAVMDVTHLPVRTENKMESFFLAETLKYHYLLQSPEDLIPLDKYVFNTEAHPLSIQV